MRFLITGATGLVGRSIVEKCLANGFDVNFLTTSKNKLNSLDGCRGFYWDPSKHEIDTACFEGVHTIINLAGSSIAKRWTPSYKRTVLNSRVDSLNTLYQALKRSPEMVTHLVSASAIGLYPSSLTAYYREDEFETADNFLGKVVTVWEAAADAFSHLGIGVAKVRIGLVLSAAGGALPQMATPVKYYAGAAFGSGEQWQSWIHIKDLTRIFLHLAEQELTGVYNGVAPNPVTQNKLIQGIAKVYDKPLWLPNIPAGALKTVLGEMSMILLDSQRVSAKKTEQTGFHFKYPNLYPALEHLLK